MWFLWKWGAGSSWVNKDQEKVPPSTEGGAGMGGRLGQTPHLKHSR